MGSAQSRQQSKVVAVVVPVLPTEDQALPMLVNADNEPPTVPENPFVVVPENVAAGISSYDVPSIALRMSETSRYNNQLFSKPLQDSREIAFLKGLLRLENDDRLPVEKARLQGLFDRCIADPSTRANFETKIVAIQSLLSHYKAFFEAYLSEFKQYQKSDYRVWPRSSDLTDSAIEAAKSKIPSLQMLRRSGLGVLDAQVQLVKEYREVALRGAWSVAEQHKLDNLAVIGLGGAQRVAGPGVLDINVQQRRLGADIEDVNVFSDISLDSLGVDYYLAGAHFCRRPRAVGMDDYCWRTLLASFDGLKLVEHSQRGLDYFVSQLSRPDINMPVAKTS